MNILKEQCATCIFRPGNPMELREGAVKSMVDQCMATDDFIPCHENMVYEDRFDDDDERLAVTSESPVCAGFHQAYPTSGQLIRIMCRLRNLWYVDAEGNRLERVTGL